MGIPLFRQKYFSDLWHVSLLQPAIFPTVSLFLQFKRFGRLKKKAPIIPTKFSVGVMERPVSLHIGPEYDAPSIPTHCLNIALAKDTMLPIIRKCEDKVN